MKKYFIKDKNYKLKEIFELINNKPKIFLSADIENLVRESQKTVDHILESSQIVYGINTGFGKLSQVKIPKIQLIKLQKNLLLSHSVGVGKPVNDEIVWTMLLIKIISLSKGFSGISFELLENLVFMLNSGYLPIVPSKGSVGASGDLAPLAHMALPLIDQGEVRKKHKVYQSKNIFNFNYSLRPKEGLAIINGTQFSCSLGIVSLSKINRLVKIADVVSALSFEALLGTVEAFRDDVQKVKMHNEQVKVAKNLNLLLKNSEINDSLRDRSKVQDMYSLRCIPQVHGASRESLKNINKIIENEINSVSDNPIVLSKTNEIVSAGHFHAEIVAQALDTAAIAVSSFANISERRIYSLIDGDFDLPPFLIENAGVNSGYMMLQVTAAALVSENKTLSYPASVDSIPTGAGQEDHVSMAPWAGRKLLKIIKNTETVLSIELLLSIQALYFRKSYKPAENLIRLHDFLKSKIKKIKNDKYFNDELNFVIELISNGNILNYVSKKIK